MILGLWQPHPDCGQLESARQRLFAPTPRQVNQQRNEARPDSHAGFLGCSEPNMIERYTGDSVAQLLQQVNYLHGLSHCQLSQISAAAVTTLGIFEID